MMAPSNSEPRPVLIVDVKRSVSVLLTKSGQRRAHGAEQHTRGHDVQMYLLFSHSDFLAILYYMGAMIGNVIKGVGPVGLFSEAGLAS
jgi:hypothetical protein